MEIFCADGAGTGRVAERAARWESEKRPARPFDALATMPRALPREADADAHDEWTLAEACYSWSRYVESNHSATSVARPDDECPCAGAARSEEYLVSCDPAATGYHLPQSRSASASASSASSASSLRSPSSSSRGVSGDAATFFVAAFACIIVACVASLAIVHRWWRREADALEEERVARAEATNPWTIRAVRERSRGRGGGGDGVGGDAIDAEGSGKTESLGGSVVRGFMYGLYVVNPSGSFTFASEKVETNGAAVEARRRAKDRSGTGEANDETPRAADETNATDAAGTDATSGVDRGVFAASDAAGEAHAAGEAYAAALAAAIESAAAEESASTRVSVDPWDTTTSNADSGTARDADEDRVRGARLSFSATRPGPGPGPEDGTR